MNNHKFLLSHAQAKISGAAQTDSISPPALPRWRPAPRVAGRMSRVGRRQRFQESREASFRLLPEPIHVPLTYGRGRVQSAAGGNAVHLGRRLRRSCEPLSPGIHSAWSLAMTRRFCLTSNTDALRCGFPTSESALNPASNPAESDLLIDFGQGQFTGY